MHGYWLCTNGVIKQLSLSSYGSGMVKTRNSRKKNGGIRKRANNLAEGPHKKWFEKTKEMLTVQPFSLNFPFPYWLVTMALYIHTL